MNDDSLVEGTCRKCGEDCFLLDDIAHHKDAASGGVDHDADADHVAILVPESV